MSPNPRSVASVVSMKHPASGSAAVVQPAVTFEESTDWRSLGGVAFTILADIDRRRRQFAAANAAAEQATKAA